MTQGMTQSAVQAATSPPPSVTGLPQQGRDDIILVAYRGVVREEDYRKNFYDPLCALVKAGRRFRVLVHFTSAFEGWEAAAADLSFRSMYENGKFAERVAVVNSPEKQVLQLKLAGDMVGGETRHFAEEDLADAIVWVRG